jgi:hypothetical protein
MLLFAHLHLPRDCGEGKTGLSETFNLVVVANHFRAAPYATCLASLLKAQVSRAARRSADFGGAGRWSNPSPGGLARLLSDPLVACAATGHPADTPPMNCDRAENS